ELVVPRDLLVESHEVAGEALLLYAVAARGNKPGGFNSDQRLPGDLVAFDEEISWNYELGLKTSLLDNRVQLNLSGYYIDWEDQQLTQNFLPAAGTPFSFVDNAGTLDVYGAEIEATARLTRDWTLRTSYAYTDPEFSGGTDAEVGTLFGDDSLVGRRPPNVSEHQFSVISDYTFDLTGDWSAFIVADYAFRSSKFAQVINEAESGDRGVANLRAGVNNESYEIILFVRNVFDNTDPVSVTRYIDSRNFLGSPFVTNRGFLAGIPRERQFGAEVRLRF
ncbi:MAG: TonB-dependent receptor, partial [Pseudomonadota bacterium]